MKKYYYAEGNISVGPFTIEELKTKNITRQTLVWYQGLDNWQPAGNVVELNELFTSAPPPPLAPPSAPSAPPPQYGTAKQPANTLPPPKTWFVESILVTLFCCMPFGIPGIVFASKVESLYFAGDYEGARRASENAKTWVSISFFIGAGWVVLTMFYLFIGGISGW